MAISDKLNYLIETKQLFKDRLNSLGAEIVESTTFRNYLSWLDNFFEKASDKTDLANNGIVGSTEQNGTPTPTNPIEIKNKSGKLSYKVSGKNLFDKDSISNNEWLLANGTTESHNDFCVSDYIPIKENTDYYLPMTNTRRLKYYNSEKQPLTTSDWDIARSTADQVITTPNNANYVRITIQYTVVDINTFQFEESSTATDYEPYIEPRTFPLDLKSKNLWGGFTYTRTNAGLTMIQNTDGSISISGTSTGSTASITFADASSNGITKTLQAGTYTVNAEGTSNSVWVRVYDANVSSSALATVEGESVTFTISEEKTVFCRFWIRASDLTFNDTFKVQLEKNAEFTSYEPYYDIELGGIGDYQDKIYSQDGRFYLDKDIGKIVLNGSETWYYSTSNVVFYCDIIRDLAIPATDYYCSHFLQVPYTTTYANMNSGETKYDSRLTPRLIFKYTNYTTVADFKSWLSSNNMTIDYILKNPIATTLTEENYPTLYKQLKDILDYLTQYKINNEFLLDYSSPEIEY